MNAGVFVADMRMIGNKEGNYASSEEEEERGSSSAEEVSEEE